MRYLNPLYQIQLQPVSNVDSFNGVCKIHNITARKQAGCISRYMIFFTELF